MSKLGNALVQRQQMLLDKYQSRLEGGVDRALSALVDIVSDSDQPGAARVAAAKELLARGLPSSEAVRNAAAGSVNIQVVSYSDAEVRVSAEGDEG